MWEGLETIRLIDHFLRTSGLIFGLPKRVGGFGDFATCISKSGVPTPNIMKMKGPCDYEDLDFATCIKSSRSLNKTIKGTNIKKEDLLCSTFEQLNPVVPIHS